MRPRSVIRTSTLVPFQSTHPMRDATKGAQQAAAPAIEFQSTHPMRDATKVKYGRVITGEFQSTHPMRDATLLAARVGLRRAFQSTHPMRDATNVSISPQFDPVFQSTHPMRDATLFGLWAAARRQISIHASHAGCDGMSYFVKAKLYDFNPRIPCGMRQLVVGTNVIMGPFQSTHPMRDATKALFDDLADLEISIHASHAGCDVYHASQFRTETGHFNPRIPCGMRP